MKSIENIKVVFDVEWFGVEKDSKGKTVKTAEESRNDYRSRFATDQEFNKAVQENIRKKVILNFTGVTVAELCKLHASETTVRKMFRNNFLAKKSLDDMLRQPAEIEVSVRELLDNRGNRMTSKTAEELQKEYEKTQRKLAKIQAELDMKMAALKGNNS